MKALVVGVPARVTTADIEQAFEHLHRVARANDAVVHVEYNGSVCLRFAQPLHATAFTHKVSL